MIVDNVTPFSPWTIEHVATTYGTETQYTYELTQGVASAMEALTAPPSPAPTGCRGVHMQVDIMTDYTPQQNGWTLTATEPCQGGFQLIKQWMDHPRLNQHHLTEQPLCNPAGGYEFTFTDTHGDGIANDGWYKVYVEGEVVAEGGAFVGMSESTTFAAGECPPCDGAWLQINVMLDARPRDKTWVLRSTSLCDGGDFEESGGPYETMQARELVPSGPICVPPGDYALTMYSQNGYGLTYGHQGYYQLLKDGVQIAQGDEFGDSETKAFTAGVCPPTTSMPTVSPSLVPAPQAMTAYLNGINFVFTPSDACIAQSGGQHIGESVEQCMQACAMFSRCLGFVEQDSACNLSFTIPDESCESGPNALFWSRQMSVQFNS